MSHIVGNLQSRNRIKLWDLKISTN